MTSRSLLAAIAAIAALTLSAPAMAADEPAPAESTGAFQVQWGSLTQKGGENGKFKKANRSAARYLKRSGAMEAVVAEVNRRWAVPEDIPVLFSDALDVGPAFFPELTLDDGTKFSLINFPGPFLTLSVKQLRKQFRGTGVSGKDAMVYASMFVLAHEVGHALVDKLDLPITGKEEDAVDGFAAYLLADNKDFGPGTALAAAAFFDAYAKLRGKLTDHDFADEHSILEQRVYQFLCWVYGSDKKTFRPIVGKDGLPRQRARRCGNEWKQVKSSWDRLLAPHAKEG